ncbi:MAG TPA: AMP nucleosidase [Alphaproteobacteria bacterium]|nr:AMP nucleosidase [Alphaproteobacteria bacterium]
MDVVNAQGHGRVHDLVAFSDEDAAVARVLRIYERATAAIRRAYAAGASIDPETERALARATYPYVGLTVGGGDLRIDARLSYGALFDPGTYGTTVTRPDIFADYYRTQIGLLLKHHGVPVAVGVSDRRIPLPFVLETSMAETTEVEVRAMQSRFALPDLGYMDDRVVNGTHRPAPGEPKPLALFSAERVDYSLQRLWHYTATSPVHFQRFLLLTNYQRYVDEFVDFARRQMASGDGEFAAFVEPGDMMTRADGATGGGETLKNLPQMPAYHLARPDRRGISLVNIGIGPSNAKTITDHLAVLRPHCWIMLGHCAGLRRTQYLGDYVLAHGYVREDHVLDRDLPLSVPVPPIAEVQVALQQAVARVTGLSGQDLKTRMRTGTVATTDDRNWELRYLELYARLNQSRAIAVDMESATVAANGFRFRVPYGTLLCVSDKPIHGEIKLRGMATALYRERISQHLMIGVETMRILRESGIDQLHSRKLRSFDEPAFR